jgi:TPR repeat protein
MAGYEDVGPPDRQRVTAAGDAYVAGRDLHVHVESPAQFREKGIAFIRPATAQPKPVSEWHPLDLGVHPAIDTDADAELPPYICRSHDRELRELLSAAPHPRMVILVGGSCTGKTRACYEAARQCLASWPMFRPADAPDLERVLTGQLSAERAVVWLDEADLYPGGRLQPDSEAAQCLQRAVTGAPGPLLVIGSMQTERWAELTAKPKDGEEDPHPHARTLLGLYEVRKIEVPENFGSAEPADLRELGLATDRDPRLAAAQRAGGETLQITQVLAGGVQMLGRYLHPPDPYSRAVITAPMDARRLGHRDPIPPSLLEGAVTDYLTDSQRAAPSQWFDRALTVAAEAVRGLSALTPVRRRPGIGDPDGYVLHDYLDEHARRTRETAAPPASLWDGLLAQTASSADLARVAAEARSRGLYRYAVLAAVRAAEAGDTGSVLFIARLLEETGRAEECVAWLLPSAEAGDEEAMLFLSEELLKSSRENRHVESLSWDRRAAESGSSRAMWKLGKLFGRADLVRQVPELVDEGIRWLRQLADRGELEAIQRLAELYEYIGEGDEAAFWRAQQARVSKPHRLSRSSQELLMQAIALTDKVSTSGEEDTAALRARAVAGDLRAMEQLGIWLDNAGQTGEAVPWLSKAADAGHYGAAWELARMLHRTDHLEEALAVIQRAAACWGDDWMSFELVLPWLRKVGGRPALESFLMAAVNAGNSWAAAYRGPELRKNGQIAEAIRVLEPAAEKRNLAAMESLGVLFEEVGHDVEARAWYQRVEQDASANMLFLLASMLENGDWPERALVRYRKAVECGETGAMKPLTDLLERIGRAEEAKRLQIFGIEPGGRTSEPWKVSPIERTARSRAQND